MRHIGTDLLPHTIVCESTTAAACNAKLEKGDQLVEAALHSDCDRCRAIVFVGPMSQKGCELREPLSYDPEPMQNIETAEQIRRRRDGL